MELIILSSSTAGPPPPPPPIYVDKPRVAKSVVGNRLHLAFQGLVEMTVLSAVSGAYLWLRGGAGKWYEAQIPASRFVDGISGTLELDVDTRLDPLDVRLQPSGHDWAQLVTLEIFQYSVITALSASPP
jgi:hypothetical protein